MRDLYFFIGTEAELMKMFIVISKARERGFNCKIISSGQNDISQSPFMKLCKSQINMDLSTFKPNKKGGLSYLQWFIKTTMYGVTQMRTIAKEYSENNKPVIIVHGDTLSSLMGSMIARKSGLAYSHVEGGLRSFNWFNPFPEELCRFFSSKYADVIFCPGKQAAETARSFFNGKAVDTVYNTNIETLQYAFKNNKSNFSPRIYQDKYFVLAIHRQENLLRKNFLEQTISSIIKLANKMHCVFVIHKQTEDTLNKYGLMDKITSNKNISIVGRLPYLEFIDVVDKAEFLIADGAGNQQEMFYMGKPYLILRKSIEENSEGLGQNAICFQEDFNMISNFDEEYFNFIRPKVKFDINPSDIIVEELVKQYGR